MMKHDEDQTIALISNWKAAINLKKQPKQSSGDDWKRQIVVELADGHEFGESPDQTRERGDDQQTFRHQIVKIQINRGDQGANHEGTHRSLKSFAGGDVILSEADSDETRHRIAECQEQQRERDDVRVIEKKKENRAREKIAHSRKMIGLMTAHHRAENFQSRPVEAWARLAKDIEWNRHSCDREKGDPSHLMIEEVVEGRHQADSKTVPKFPAQVNIALEPEFTVRTITLRSGLLVQHGRVGRPVDAAL